MLQGDLDDHLGYEKHAPEGRNSGNSRNGSRSKEVKSESLGDVVLSISRDRNSSFEPKLIPKHQRMSEQIEQSIIGMYSRGVILSTVLRLITYFNAAARWFSNPEVIS